MPKPFDSSKAPVNNLEAAPTTSATSTFGGPQGEGNKAGLQSEGKRLRPQLIHKFQFQFKNPVPVRFPVSEPVFAGLDRSSRMGGPGQTGLPRPPPVKTGFSGSKTGRITANSKTFGISAVSEPVSSDLGSTSCRGGPGQNRENPEKPDFWAQETNKVPANLEKSKIPVPIPVSEPVSANLDSTSRMRSPAQEVAPISYGKLGSPGSKTGNLPRKSKILARLSDLDPVFPVSPGPGSLPSGKTGLVLHTWDLSASCLALGSLGGEGPEKQNPETNIETNKEIRTPPRNLKQGDQFVNYSDSESSGPDPEYHIYDTDSQDSQGSPESLVSNSKPKPTPKPRNSDSQESQDSQSPPDQTAASGCSGETKAKPWPPWLSWPQLKAKIQAPFLRRKNTASEFCQLQIASKVASGCSGETKAKPWPPWLSRPLIKAIQDPKNSRPRFTTLPIGRRNPVSAPKPFSLKVCQQQTTSETASKAASGCSGETKAKPWPPWLSWPQFKAQIQALFLRQQIVPVTEIYRPRTTSKTASKAASRYPGGIKVRSWPRWTSWPSFRAIQGPKNSRPRLSIGRRKNPVSVPIPFSLKVCQLQMTASKTAPGCPRGTKVRPWPRWTPWPSFRAIQGPKNWRQNSGRFMYIPHENSMSNRPRECPRKNCPRECPREEASGYPGGTKVKPWSPIRGIQGPKNPMRPKPPLRSQLAKENNKLSCTSQYRHGTVGCTPDDYG